MQRHATLGLSASCSHLWCWKLPPGRGGTQRASDETRSLSSRARSSLQLGGRRRALHRDVPALVSLPAAPHWRTGPQGLIIARPRTADRQLGVGVARYFGKVRAEPSIAACLAAAMMGFLAAWPTCSRPCRHDGSVMDPRMNDIGRHACVQPMFATATHTTPGIRRTNGTELRGFALRLTAWRVRAAGAERGLRARLARSQRA